MKKLKWKIKLLLKKMNSFLLEQCQKFMKKLYNKPIANMLKENWTDLSGRLTLDKINEKLNSNVYASLFDFYLDIRLLLEQRDPQNQENAVINIILEDLTQWVTYKFHNMPRTPEELEYIKIHKLAQKVNMIFGAMIIKVDNSNDASSISSNINGSPNLNATSPSLSGLSMSDTSGIYSMTTSSAYSPINGFNNYGSYGQLMSLPKQSQASQKNLETLQQRIEHLRTPKELQAILKILQKHIPQFTLAPEVVIEGRYITKACYVDLKEYLDSVNA